MKKILLLALPLMVMCFASCEKNKETEADGVTGGVTEDGIIIFKDPNFLEALLVVKQIELFCGPGIYDYTRIMMDVDKNKDGQISVDEAKEVKGLNLEGVNLGDSYNITDMSEIKYFTSLTTLECYDNQITSLDVSNNAALTHLYCYSNQLTNLDVSNNTALVLLECSDNQLKNLDVSKCTALTYLGCGINNLTSLDLSKNTKLNDLYCAENNLEKLILYEKNNIDADSMEDIKSEYGDIIEYAE